jgi:hypothetical protein
MAKQPKPELKVTVDILWGTRHLPRDDRGVATPWFSLITPEGSDEAD